MRNKLFILLILFSAVARHYSHLSLKGRNSGMSGRMRPCRSFPVSLLTNSSNNFRWSFRSGGR